MADELAGIATQELRERGVTESDAAVCAVC